MHMITLLAAVLVTLMGLYLISLGVTAAIYPGHATRFLHAHASSAFAHVLELSLRLIAGAALLLYAPHMRFGALFAVFGGILVVSTLVMFLIPWRWHQRFAQRSVPWATRRLAIVAIAAVTFGLFVIASVLMGARG